MTSDERPQSPLGWSKSWPVAEVGGNGNERLRYIRDITCNEKAAPLWSFMGNGGDRRSPGSEKGERPGEREKKKFDQDPFSHSIRLRRNRRHHAERDITHIQEEPILFKFRARPDRR